MSPHLQLNRKANVIPWYELYIDVGASSIDEVKELDVEILNPVTFNKNLILMNKSKVIAGKAIDDRVRCYVLIKLAKLLSEEISEVRKIEIYFA